MQVATAFTPSTVTAETSSPFTVIRQLIEPGPAPCTLTLGTNPPAASNSFRQGSRTLVTSVTGLACPLVKLIMSANGAPSSSYRTRTNGGATGTAPGGRAGGDACETGGTGGTGSGASSFGALISAIDTS